ncbi:peptidoglycan DD-metalloendopeptidase family protein [Thioalkalivibrio sp.]|uniref:murein hydrolase activator EnvC family protein n=1 Tax=Thioalkalivibrio sp. TaxID=2093813 RepID=UPI0025E53A21|nr:peptidoglycan DD-metalloendopeptidase family protein [Thioalkalivibrio sp.]
MEKAPRLQPLGWFLAALALFAIPAAAVETGAELEATREAMQALEREQQQRLREIERLEERVAEVARRNQGLRAEQRGLAAAVAEQDRAVAARQEEVDQRERELAAAREQARQLLRGQWLRERHQGWAPSDDRIGRHQRPLDARVQAQRELALAEIAGQVDALVLARDRLASARDELIVKETEARRMLREIARQEEELGVLLARVQTEVESDAVEIERLERNAQTLEDVVRRMAAQAAEKPPEPAARTAQPLPPGAGTLFSNRRGSLAHPVDGGFLHRFGSQRGGGLQAQWRGEVFEVGDDAAVRAVHPGQAVYADWMHGYGFLVILDHGEGYLTLYGNNRELLARQGQQVAAGDVIAQAGATSTVIAPGLYFELRHEGQTLNPRPWWHSK